MVVAFRLYIDILLSFFYLRSNRLLYMFCYAHVLVYKLGPETFTSIKLYTTIPQITFISLFFNNLIYVLI